MLAGIRNSPANSFPYPGGQNELLDFPTSYNSRPASAPGRPQHIRINPDSENQETPPPDAERQQLAPTLQ